MLSTVKQMLKSRGISLCAPILLCDATVLRPHLLRRAEIEDGTAFLFAVPYYTTFCDDPARNISAYAVSRDYHLFFKQLFHEILPILQEKFPAHKFAGFSDHSPIDEVGAAARAGLGAIGKNHLFLTSEHSSFMFLGEIITDAILPVTPHPVDVCTGCNACLRACPVDLVTERCLSALTQKKGELTAEERSAILENGCLWGCDTCQNVCPVTKKARETGSLYTKIPFFTEHTITHLTKERLDTISDEEFAERAYAWRGRQVIARNLTMKEEA